MPASVVDVVVVGPVTRDISLRIEGLPPAAGSAIAGEIRVAAGGKGGNPAVCAARLGARVRLLGAVGDDGAGREVLAQLAQDGIDVSAVTCCRGATTGQIVHLVEPGAARRYVESQGANAQLKLGRERMARRCRPGTVALVSTALPRAAVEDAVHGAADAGARVIVDLAGESDTSRAALAGADVVRGDADEIGELTGCPVRDFGSARTAAERLLAQGPTVAIVQAGEEGDLVLSSEGEIRLPHLPVPAVDPTGAGDALVTTFAVLVSGGAQLKTAARLAAAAAAHTVGHLGGRPSFSGEAELAALARRG